MIKKIQLAVTKHRPLPGSAFKLGLQLMSGLALILPLTFSIAAQATCIATSSGDPYTTATGCEALSNNAGESNTATGF